MDADWFDMLLKDPRIVRNGARIRSVQRNAMFILDETERLASFGAFIAAWQHKDFADVLDYLRKHGDRLGDKTAQYFLREAGVDSYVLSFDVLKRLSLEGVADTLPASSKQRVVSRMWWKLASSGLRACNDGSSQAARSRDIGSSG